MGHPLRAMNTQNLLELSDEELINAHLQAADSGAAKGVLTETEAGRAMLEADADRRANLAAAGLQLWLREQSCDGYNVVSALLRTEPKAWTATRLIKVVEVAAQFNRLHPKFVAFQWFPHKPLMSAVEKVAEKDGLPENLRAALERWKAALMPRALTPQEERELGEAERPRPSGRRGPAPERRSPHHGR